jgi:hypothetical protein
MTNNVLYASSPLLDKITKMAANRFNRNYDDIGLVSVRVEESKYQKQGQTFVKELISFPVYDHSMQKIGVIKRKDVMKYANGKAKQG